MIPRDLLPTVLIRAAERPPVARADPASVSAFRTWHVARHLAALLAAAAGLWARRRLDGAAAGRLVRAFLERMGTVWIKAGQILSLHSDLLPADFCLELSRLRDRGVAFPFDEARRIVEDELGGPLERYFEGFAETPFAATSIAQLHRARLRSKGVEVAVKIQQPGAAHAFNADFRLIRGLAAVLDRLAIPRHMQWSGLCRELHTMMTRELDFAYEASSLRRLRRTLRRHGVYVPTVFIRYSRTRVLVMEYIQAALMSDLIDLRQRDPMRLARWLQANNIEPRRVGRRLFDSVLRQVLEDNLFHGDLHPHNLVLLRNSRLAVIDCRSVGSLEVERLARHALYLRAIAESEFAMAADVQFLLSTRLPIVDLAEVKEELIRVWRTWEGRTHIRALPYDERSLTAMFEGVNQVVSRHRFAVQWSLSRLARTFANLDISLKHLHPTLNATRWLRRYFTRAAARGRRDRSRKMPRRATRAVVAAARLPRMFSESTVLQQGIVRRQAQVLEGSTTKAGELLAAVLRYTALLLLLAGAMLLGAFVDRQGLADIARVGGAQLAGVIRMLPPWSPWVWLAAAAAVLLARRSASGLARRLAQKPVRVPEVPPSV